MRPLHLCDIREAVRVLLALPPARRPSVIAGAIARAEAADRHRQATGQVHRRWGDGTLAAAVARLPRAPDRVFEDRDCATCWAMVLDAVLRRREGSGLGL